MARQCRPIVIDGRQVGFACGTRARVPNCSTPGCTNRGMRQCDYQVTRAKGSQTCDAYVCVKCATRIAHEKDFCPPHAKLAKDGG